MSVGALDAAMSGTADLTQTMLGGELKKADLAMNVAKVGMEMQLKGQEMAQTQEAVAMLTGVGGSLDTVA